MKYFRNAWRYFIFLLNYLKYKPFFRESQSFFIGGQSIIIGTDMIKLGNKFFAHTLLRIEVFGDRKTIKLKIGDNVSLGRNVHIGVKGNIEIADNVLIGSNVLITDHNHGIYSGTNRRYSF